MDRLDLGWLWYCQRDGLLLEFERGGGGCMTLALMLVLYNIAPVYTLGYVLSYGFDQNQFCILGSFYNQYITV